MRLRNKVAVLTGGAKGIGETIVYEFVKEGALVAICDVDEDSLMKVNARVTDMNGTCLPFVGNILNRDFVDLVFSSTFEEFGKIDILVNNAGINRDALLHKMTEEQWNQVIDVNLKGTFFCLQAAARYMMDQGKGVIVNISSIARFGNPGQLNYSASKGGIVSMTRTVAKELAHKNITCNCISPGPIWTEMLKRMPEKLREKLQEDIPLRRFGTPQDVANLCLFLASDEASYITGQTINCDGGLFMT